MLMQRLKVLVSGAGIGSALTLITAIFLGERLVAWRWEPPEQEQLTCAPAVRSALGSLVAIELWSAAVGALLGIVIALLIVRRTEKPAAPPSKSP